MTSKEDLTEIVDKIDYEGGLYEYLMHYAGVKGMPEEVREEAKAAEEAFEKLQTAFNDLCHDRGVY